MADSASIPQRGRPRAELAGEVDRRLLAAARSAILQEGYSRASMDHIADVARASKSTLYTRYPTKADLFAAVVTQSEVSLPRPAGEGSRRDRLIAAGLDLADATLTADNIALMRATSAETDTFPDVARKGFQLGFQSCARHIAAASAGTDEDLEPHMSFARRFIEIALHPLYMHAFFGADLGALRTRARTDVPEAINHLMALEAP